MNTPISIYDKNNIVRTNNSILSSVYSVRNVHKDIAPSNLFYNKNK